MVDIVTFCKALVEKHPGTACFFVGGCVRDALLEIKPKDFDIIIQHCSLTNIENELRALCVKYDLVGKSFGVIKARFEEGVVDIALPRKEVSTGTGHKDFDVQCDPEISLEEDARRRDFTINAIYSNILTGGITDPTLGSIHLVENTLRATSENSYSDDPLRILRAIQFCARFQLRLGGRDFKLIRCTSHMLKFVSPERVALELGKLMLADRPSVGLHLALLTDILNIVLPELYVLNSVDQPTKFHDANAFEHTLRVVDNVRQDINLRFAALFHDLGKAETKIMHEGRIAFHGHEDESAKITTRIIDRLKLTTIEGFDTNKILTLVRNHMYDRHYTSASAVRRLVRKVGGMDMFHLQAQLKVADVLGGGYPYKACNQLGYLHHVCKIMEKTTTKSVNDLAVNGNDVMNEYDLAPGPLVGKILSIMFEGVENDLVKNDKDELFTWFELNLEDV